MKPFEWLSLEMSVLWSDGAEVVLPLSHASPLLVHGAGHDGHCGVHLVCPPSDPGDLVLVTPLLVHLAGHSGHCEDHLVRLLGDLVELVAGHVVGLVLGEPVGAVVIPGTLACLVGGRPCVRDGGDLGLVLDEPWTSCWGVPVQNGNSWAEGQLHHLVGHGGGL